MNISSRFDLIQNSELINSPGSRKKQTLGQYVAKFSKMWIFNVMSNENFNVLRVALMFLCHVWQFTVKYVLLSPVVG